jgi:hypothetical protein
MLIHPYTVLALGCFGLIRFLYMKTGQSVLVYHFVLFIVFFVIIIGGGGAVSDAYERLDISIALEKANPPEHIKEKSALQASMLDIDQVAFKHFDERLRYIRGQEAFVQASEKAALGYICILLADIIKMIATRLIWIRKKMLKT